MSFVLPSPFFITMKRLGKSNDVIRNCHRRGATSFPGSSRRTKWRLGEDPGQQWVTGLQKYWRFLLFQIGNGLCNRSRDLLFARVFFKPQFERREEPGDEVELGHGGARPTTTRNLNSLE